MHLLRITSHLDEEAGTADDLVQLTREWQSMPGFRVAFTSTDADNATTVAGLWEDDRTAGEARSRLPLHLAGNATLSAVNTWVEPTVGEVRHIRTKPPKERLPEVVQFWQHQGRDVIESWPGCVKARGYVDHETSEFVLVIWWRSAEDAEQFRLSDFHEREFVQPLGADVVRLTRTHLDPVQQPTPRPSSW